MKFVVVGPTYPYRGGIAHHTTGFVRQLRRRHEVVFFAYRRQYPARLYPGRTDRDPSRQPARADVDGWIDVLNPIDWLATARRIHATRADALILPWTVPYWAPFITTIARLARRGDRRPVIVFDCHNVLPHEPGPFDRAAVRLAFSQADVFLVHAASDRAVLRTIRPAARVVQVPLPPPAIDAAIPERAAARRILGFAPDDRIALFFGFVRPYKGLQDLIQAVALARRSAALRLVVAGEFWEPRARYDRMIGALGLDDAVTIVDRYIPDEEAVQYIAAADVVVLPYVRATQSAVIPLAFHVGRPVIATTVGGLPEAVEDRQTGLLVPPGDPVALAAALTACFTDGLAERLAANVRARAVTPTWDRFEAGLLQAIALVTSPPADLRGVAYGRVDR